MEKLSFVALLVLICAVLATPFALAEETMTAFGSHCVYADDYIYYVMSGNDGRISINKIRDDGTEAQRLAAEGGDYYLSVAGDTLYMIGTGGIKRIMTDGSGFEALEGAAGGWRQWIIATGEYVYAFEDYRITRFTAEPWAKVSEFTVPERFGDKILIEDGWIYLADREMGGGKFYKVRTDGTENSAWFEPKANEGDELTYWEMRDGKLYYALAGRSENAMQLRRVDLDGKNDELVLAGMCVGFMDDEWAYGTLPKEADKQDSGDHDHGYIDQKGFWRGNLVTGEFEYLGEQQWQKMRLSGDCLVEISDDWGGDNAPKLHKKDMSASKTLT